MASPFSLFRKNQKVMMALLVGLSMIAFIVVDSINAENFPIFLGAIFGSLALWLLSGKGGTEGWLIAGLGAVVGGVLGLYGPGLLVDNTVAYTAKGNLSASDLNQIGREQQIANDFLSHAARMVHEELPDDQKASYRGPEPFGYVNVVDAGTQRENSVLTFLFSAEADEMGITFSDDAVQKYISDVTQGKMGDAEFRKIRGDMQVGTSELIAALRSQLRAREAFRLLVPRTSPTPQELWADYLKLSVEANANVATIPADAFVAEVGEPSDAEIAALFESYKLAPPTGDGTPGFLVPRKIQVASLEIAMADLRNSVTPPTDEEVLAYYERNRAQYEFQQTTPPGTSPSESTLPGDTPADASAPVEAPRPAAAANRETEPAPAGEPAPEAALVPAEAPRSSPESPAEPPAGESAPEENTPESDAPAAEPEGDAPAGENETSALFPAGAEFVAFQEDEAATPAPADPAPADTPAESAPEDVAPPLPTAPAAQPAGGPPSEAILATIRRDLINQRARTAADALVEETLNDVHDLISKVEETLPYPEDPRDPKQQAEYEKARRALAGEIIDELKAYGQAKDLNFSLTPYLSGRDLYESEDYPVGGAVVWEKNAPLFGRESTPIIDQMFRSSSDLAFTPIPGQNLLNESRYIALKVADAPEHVGSLENDEVRKQVVEAWKLQQARELAKQRADELVKKAADQEKPLGEILGGETVTGTEEGTPLTTRPIGPFTWLRRSTMPGQGFQLPDIAPNELPQLPAAGEEFMRSVFESLKPGETGVAPATDGSAYYVVQVESRSGEEEIAKLHDEFLKENPFFFLSPFRVRMSNEAFELRQKWFDAFRTENEVIYNVTDEAVPG